jgi:hypothetical protein
MRIEHHNDKQKIIMSQRKRHYYHTLLKFVDGYTSIQYEFCHMPVHTCTNVHTYAMVLINCGM